VVLKTLSKWLKVDTTGGEDAYVDLVRGVDKKPLASLEGLRYAQRLLKTRYPKVGEVKAEDVIDNRLMKKTRRQRLHRQALPQLRSKFEIAHRLSSSAFLERGNTLSWQPSLVAPLG